MELTTTPAPTTQNFGSLREYGRGAPEHAAFVVANATPADGSAPVALSTQGGSRLWQSFAEDATSVMHDAQQAAAAAGQAMAVVTAEPGHWQQYFVLPLFRAGDGGVQQAVAGLNELDAAAITHSKHLVGLADATSSIDVRSLPVADDLMPPRARPGAF